MRKAWNGIRVLSRKSADCARTYSALLSDRINPIADRNLSVCFKISRLMAIFSAIGFVLGLWLLVMPDSGNDIFYYVRHCATMVLNACIVYINFKDMVKFKKNARMEKTLDVIDACSDEYETMTLKLAVAHPQLPPPSKEEYEQARARVERERTLLEIIGNRFKVKLTRTGTV